MQGNLGVERMCQLAEVSRASFYRSLQERVGTRPRRRQGNRRARGGHPEDGSAGTDRGLPGAEKPGKYEILTGQRRYQAVDFGPAGRRKRSIWQEPPAALFRSLQCMTAGCGQARSPRPAPAEARPWAILGTPTETCSSRPSPTPKTRGSGYRTSAMIPSTA